MIKEILYLEDYINKYKYDEKAIINGNRLTTPAMLDYLEAKELIDYITNLQEENERLKEILHWKQIENNIFYKSRIDKAIEEKEIPEKLDYIHPDISCSYNESELLLRIEANKDKINSIIDYLKRKGENNDI